MKRLFSEHAGVVRQALRAFNAEGGRLIEAILRRAFTTDTLRSLLMTLARVPVLRIAFLLPKTLGDWGSIRSDRPTVLIVCHEGTLSGAPILGLNIGSRLLDTYNVVFLFLGRGALLQSIPTQGAVVVHSRLPRAPDVFARLALKGIMKRVKFEFAIVNSIESRSALRTLADRRVPAITLVHEFSAYTRPRTAFPMTIRDSSVVVFSSKIVRDNMIADFPDFDPNDFPIIPQGKCILSPPSEAQRQIESVRVRRAMRPESFPDDGIVVIGLGPVDFRKGVEIFVECATRVLQRRTSVPIRFIWVGKGHTLDKPNNYSVFVADQVARSNVGAHLEFVDEVAALDEVYALADILMLTSRLDPLPNVAIDALTRGLPMVCFDRATGIADELKSNGMGEQCVATYLDTVDMADKVIALAESKTYRTEVAEKALQWARPRFDMAHYVEQLEGLAAREPERAVQFDEDLQTLAASQCTDWDYFHSRSAIPVAHGTALTNYLHSWRTGVWRRKLMPGFEPGVYREELGVDERRADPLAQYLRRNRPPGPWARKVLSEADALPEASFSSRIALHIHAFYPDLFVDIVHQLLENKVRPDLFVSVPSEQLRGEVEVALKSYPAPTVIRIVPNRGRDIGALLTEFGPELVKNYDLIGHLHTKKSPHAKQQLGEDWFGFLMANLVGGRTRMADRILHYMEQNPRIGITFPDDPHVVNWGLNRPFAKRWAELLGIDINRREIIFPVGTMFWARASALCPFVELGLEWKDYPFEPLPIDGSILHAIERLFGVSQMEREDAILLTHVSGTTR